MCQTGVVTLAWFEHQAGLWSHFEIEFLEWWHQTVVELRSAHWYQAWQLAENEYQSAHQV